MLKKIGYFYLFTAAGCLLLGLVALGVGVETGVGFILGIYSAIGFSFLLCTAPVWLIIFVLRGMFISDERFHAENRQDTN
jgi:hypothetical protein